MYDVVPCSYSSLCRWHEMLEITLVGQEGVGKSLTRTLSRVYCANGFGPHLFAEGD